MIIDERFFKIKYVTVKKILMSSNKSMLQEICIRKAAQCPLRFFPLTAAL